MKPGDLVSYNPLHYGEPWVDKIGVVLHVKPISSKHALATVSWTCDEKPQTTEIHPDSLVVISPSKFKNVN